jgi:hypothetical protein
MLMLAITLSCIATLLVIDHQKASMRRRLKARTRSSNKPTRPRR